MPALNRATRGTSKAGAILTALILVAMLLPGAVLAAPGRRSPRSPCQLSANVRCRACLDGRPSARPSPVWTSPIPCPASGGHRRHSGAPSSCVTCPGANSSSRRKRFGHKEPARAATSTMSTRSSMTRPRRHDHALAARSGRRHCTMHVLTIDRTRRSGSPRQRDLRPAANITNTAARSIPDREPRATAGRSPGSGRGRLELLVPAVQSSALRRRRPRSPHASQSSSQDQFGNVRVGDADPARAQRVSARPALFYLHDEPAADRPDSGSPTSRAASSTKSGLRSTSVRAIGGRRVRRRQRPSTVRPGPADQARVQSIQPAHGIPGIALSAQPVIVDQDDFGNTVDFGVRPTIALDQGPAGPGRIRSHCTAAARQPRSTASRRSRAAGSTRSVSGID